MSTAFAQSVDDGMDGYVKGTSGIYTGNPNECCIAKAGTLGGNNNVRAIIKSLWDLRLRIDMAVRRGTWDWQLQS